MALVIAMAMVLGLMSMSAFAGVGDNGTDWEQILNPQAYNSTYQYYSNTDGDYIDDHFYKIYLTQEDFVTQVSNFPPVFIHYTDDEGTIELRDTSNDPTEPTEPTDNTITATSGTITVENAAKGETYKIFKIFDATISTVAGDDGKADSISYTYPEAELPETLATAFEIETIGGTNYVKIKDGVDDDAVLEAVQNYIATLPDSAATDSAVGDGNPVVFSDLDFGYYGVKSTQGAVVTIDSANPDAVIYDKNTTNPEVEKVVGDDSYSIGDTVEYTSTFSTPNFLGEGANAKQVTKIKVEDTLPEFLSGVTVKS